MIPVRFPESNLALAMEQDEYEPLEVHLQDGHEGRVTCCFRLSDAELAEMIRTRTLWIQVMTFNRGFAPILLSTQKPEMT